MTNWPTPQTDSFRSRGGTRKHELGLDRMARDWPTPKAITGGPNSKRAERGAGGPDLQEVAAQWPTPMASDGNKPSAGNRKTADLTHAAGMWMTPTARDYKDGSTSLANVPVNGLLGRQVLTTLMPGDNSSDARRTLNPLFVEALMGWPTGWTGFDFVETEWSPWLRRMRCELSRLNSSGIGKPKV